MGKLLRLIRLMRSFKELRLILNMIFGCAKSILWSTALIFAVSYIFGIAFMQGCITYLETGLEVDEKTIQEIDDYWSSIGKSMLSLFVAAMGGVDWQETGLSLLAAGWVFYGLFLFYVFFFNFVISNTISSIFLEAVMNLADSDHQLVVQMQMEKKEDYVHSLQNFFDEIDVDEDGEVTYDEFCKHMESPLLLAFAESLEIDTSDAKQFFHILSGEGKHKVDIETFVVGCIKLKGAAKSMDLMDLACFQKDATKQILNALHRVDNFVSSIHDTVSQDKEQPEFRGSRAADVVCPRGLKL